MFFGYWDVSTEIRYRLKWNAVAMCDAENVNLKRAKTVFKIQIFAVFAKSVTGKCI